MVHGTLSSYDNVYEVSSNYFHLLVMLDKEMLQTHVQMDRWTQTYRWTDGNS